MSIDFWRAESLERLPWLRHGFTHRVGGVSETPFASLNLGLHVGDDPVIVSENRQRMASVLGFDLAQIVCAEQVHGGKVAVVTESEAGRGATDMADTVPGTDALVTQTPNLLLTLFFADCVPVFFADPKKRVIGIAHGGWRGLVSDVLENTILSMESLGSERGDLLAAVGPCIGPNAFEVGEEVAAHFTESARIIGDKPHVDLPHAAKLRLMAQGIPAENITLSGECTASRLDHYFSHRQERGKTGRMAAAIAIRTERSND